MGCSDFPQCCHIEGHPHNMNKSAWLSPSSFLWLICHLKIYCVSLARFPPMLYLGPSTLILSPENLVDFHIIRTELSSSNRSLFRINYAHSVEIITVSLTYQGSNHKRQSRLLKRPSFNSLCTILKRPRIDSRRQSPGPIIHTEIGQFFYNNHQHGPTHLRPNHT